MGNFKRHIMTYLAALTCVLLAVPTMAQVMNGDFENGGSDWIEFSDPGLGVSYPAAGGNPGVYARLESDFSRPGGWVCITQTIQCGNPTVGTECTGEVPNELGSWGTLKTLYR